MCTSACINLPKITTRADYANRNAAAQIQTIQRFKLVTDSGVCLLRANAWTCGSLVKLRSRRSVKSNGTQRIT